MIIAPGTYHSFFDLGSNCCESMSFPPTTWQPCPDSSAVCRCGHRLLWEKGYRGFSSLFSGEVRTSTPVLHWGRTVFSLQDPTVPIKHVIPAKPAYASTWSDTANAKEMVDAALEMKSALRVPNGMLEISVEGGISKDSEASVREVPRETTKESRPVKGDFAAVVGRDQESGSNYFYIGQVLNVTADGMATLVWFRKGSDGLFRKENREKWTEHVQSLVPVSLSWVSSKKNSKGGTGGHRLVSPSSKQLLNARVVSAPLTDVN